MLLKEYLAYRNNVEKNSISLHSLSLNSRRERRGREEGEQGKEEGVEEDNDRQIGTHAHTEYKNVCLNPVLSHMCTK